MSLGRSDIQVTRLTQPNAGEPHFEKTPWTMWIYQKTPENSSRMVGSYIHQKGFIPLRIVILSSYSIHSSKRYVGVGREVGCQLKEENQGWRKVLKLWCKSVLIQNLKCENPFLSHNGSFCKVKYTWPSWSRAKIGVKCLSWWVGPRRGLGHTKIQSKALDSPSIPFLGTKWALVCPKVGSHERLESRSMHSLTQSVFSPEPLHTDLPHPLLLQARRLSSNLPGSD